VCQTDGQNLRQLKNIYVGETRIATRLSIKGDGSTRYEEVNTYYYHADHLSSAQLISDYEGKEYERIEYTPYGESWIEKASDGLAKLPYRFTGKERDSETGLYYYGARYLNPTTGLWLSTDPALAEYLPVAPVDDEAKKHNEKLPGMGGAYNLVNLALYHYAGNNPVKYTDPDGEAFWFAIGIAVVLLTIGGTAHAPTIYKPDTISKIQNILYDDGKPNPRIEDINSIITYDSIILESNSIAAVGAALPRGELTPDDYDDGNKSTIGSVMGAIGLAGKMAENLTDGNGNLNGDVKLVLRRSNGRICSWSITATIVNPFKGKNLVTIVMSKEEAVNYLIENQNRLESSGVLENVEKKLTN
jgi:RHS repeat-associated protein